MQSLYKTGAAVEWGKESGSLKTKILHTFDRAQQIHLDAAMVFGLAASDHDPHASPLAVAIVAARPDIIESSLKNITNGQPFTTARRMALVINEIASIASVLDVTSLGEPALDPQNPVWPDWLDTGSIIRKAGHLVTAQIESSSPGSEESFQRAVRDLFDPNMSPLAAHATQGQRLAHSRKEAIKTGIVIAGALHAATRITQRDQAQLQAIEDGTSTAVSAALGGALVPGAVLAPIVALAINRSLDYA